MCSSGGGGGTTTVQKADPWSGVQPFLLGSQTTRLKQGVQPIYRQEQTWNPNSGDGGAWETHNVINNPSSDYETIGAPGVYPESQRLYQSGQWSPQMQSLTDTQGQAVANRTPGQVGQLNQFGSSLYGGQFDPNVQRVGSIAGASAIVPQNVNAAQIAGAPSVNAAQIAGADRINSQAVNPSGAFASLGSANPTGSIQQMLSGQANTATLDPVVNNALRRLSDNFNEQVMPSINQGAVAAGQYGGSRQGIAQGLAAKGLALSMGDTANNLYNQAYQQAQQNMYGTANNMAGLGLSNAQGNATRDLSAQTTNATNQLSAQQFNANALNSMGQFNAANAQDAQKFNANATNSMGQFNADNSLKAQGLNAANALNAQQFNANLGLQNNSQAMQLAQQQVANRLQGLNAIQAGNTLNDQAYQQQMGLLNAPNDYNWQNLNKYASIVSPGAGIGSSSTSSQSSDPGLLGSLGSVGSTAANIAMAGKLFGWWSDRRLKTDIKKVGVTDGGLNIYTFRYKSGGPVQMGVMAQEVEQVIPEAVFEVDGFKMVNYALVR